ncbi:MAG: hypothetical protein GY696_19740 [Gammaproteobacteria bacterium]|nr:hypothetical protein [Gammaproteobacteria bacterium]
MRYSVFSFLVLLIASVQTHAEPIIFPAQGQSTEQQEKDKFECYSWAKQQSGFDPMSVNDTAVQQPQAKSGGAARGALAGGAAGAIFGDSKKNTRNSAAAGAIIGGSRQSRANKKSQQQAQQQASTVAARRNTYDRAHAACLEGKGYTVK